MKAILLLIGLFIAVPLLSQENRDSIKAAIASEIALLTTQKEQLKSMLGLLRAQTRVLDSMILGIKIKNIQNREFVDTMDVKVALLKKSDDKSKATKKLVKEWKQARLETLKTVTQNTAEIDGMEKDQKLSLDDYKQAEEMINKLEKQIEELKKLDF